MRSPRSRPPSSFTDSIALLADLVHNLGDVLTAVPLTVAFLFRSLHAEHAAGLVVTAVILLSALLAGALAVERLVHPQAPEYLLALALAGAVGVAGNMLAARMRLAGGRRLDSAALTAEGLHARGDALVSVGVVCSAAALWAGAPIIDPLIGLVITGLIVRVGWQSYAAVSSECRRACA